VYQAYLKQVNDIKEKYKECLLLGRYNDVFGFTCSNDKLDARSFLSEDGSKMAVVVAHQDMNNAETMTAQIDAPGYRLVESSVTGNGHVGGNTSHRVRLEQYDMAVLLFEIE
jgi:hypothetical protein